MGPHDVRPHLGPRCRCDSHGHGGPQPRSGSRSLPPRRRSAQRSGDNDTRHVRHINHTDRVFGTPHTPLREQRHQREAADCRLREDTHTREVPRICRQPDVAGNDDAQSEAQQGHRGTQRGLRRHQRTAEPGAGPTPARASATDDKCRGCALADSGAHSGKHSL